MPERIYLNRRTGEERVHIELAAHEIADVLGDWDPPPADAFAATKDLHALLVAAAHDLNLTCRLTEEPQR